MQATANFSERPMHSTQISKPTVHRAIGPKLQLAAIVLLLANSVCAAQVEQGNGVRPNFVIIVSDDQRFDQLGCAGHPHLATPNVDRLATDGVRFERAFVTTPICAASRASILTGLYERTHHFTFGTPPLAKEFCLDSYPALLKAAGYRTGFVGKLGVNLAEDSASKMFDELQILSRTPYIKRQPDGSTRHVTQITGDRAVDFLQRQAADQPFCLTVCFNAPHAEDNDKQTPFPWPTEADGLYEDVTPEPPRLADPAIFASQPDFLKRSFNRQRWYWRWDTPEKYSRNIRAYWRMISGVDAVVGRIAQELHARHLDQNTLVIYTSDNGLYLGDRGLAGKWSHYDESLRVPLIVYDPRSTNSGQPSRVRSEIALNVDLAPTVLDYAGLSVPPSMQGRSLKPLVEPDPRVQQGEEALKWRTDFFCEHLFHLPNRIPKWEGVRDERWVYARYFEQQPAFEFLHDLKNDPDELVNLAITKPNHPQLKVMRQRMKELRQSLGGEYLRQRFPSRDSETLLSPSQRTRPPNIVLIISDDQHWGDYSFMGHPSIHTPRLDQLADQSAVFPRGYVPTSLCSPSLAQHPVRALSQSARDYRQRPGLAGWLNRGGGSGRPRLSAVD